MITAIEPFTHAFKIGSKESKAVAIHYVVDASEIPEFLEWVSRLERRLLLVDIESDGSSKDGLDWQSRKIATLQIGNPLDKDPRAYVFCIRSLGDEVLAPVLALLGDPTYMKLGQNIRFEVSWLTHRFDIPFNNVFCTQVTELVLRAGLFPMTKTVSEEQGPGRGGYTASSMKALATRYLDVQIEKGDDVRLKFWVTPPGELSRAQLVYAAGDVIYPAYIAREQKQEILDRGLSSIIAIEMELIPILADSERAGICIDGDSWMELYREACRERAEAEQKLNAMLLPVCTQLDGFTGANKPTVPTVIVGGRSREVNYDAPEQVRRLFVLYCRSIQWPVHIVGSWSELNKLKREYGKDWLRRNPSKLEADTPDFVIPETEFLILLKMESPQLRIARARKQLPAELVDAYIAYKDASKRAGTYGENFLKHVDPRTNRIHVYYHQVLTSTGRLSAQPNLQNIPRDSRYRACFIPRDGWRFVSADFSQIEPRLSAEVSDDNLYCSTFLAGDDIYVRVGEAQLGQTIDKSTEEGKMLRQGAKTVVLATAYGMSSRKLRDSLTLNLEPFILAGKIEPPSFEMAAQLLKSFFEVAPKIKTYQELCVAQADPENSSRPKIYDRYLKTAVTYVTSICSRKRFFPPDAKNTYTESMNAPIQCASATITKLASILLWRRVQAAGIPLHFVNYVHDELVAETKAEHAEMMFEWLKECMIEAGQKYIKKVPVLVEGPGIIDCWRKE